MDTSSAKRAPSHVGAQSTPRAYFPYTSRRTDVWDIVKAADRCPDDPDAIVLLYSRYTIAPGEAGKEHLRQWSREHCWPQSAGGMSTTRPGMGTDAHNLFAADRSMNSARSNKGFDEGGGVVRDRSPLEDHAASVDCLSTRDTWEPPDEAKGVAARAMLYMACVYASSGLRLGETSDPEARRMGRLSALLDWNRRFPPSAWEVRRNGVVEAYQGNRNPFVDRPELAEEVDWARCGNEAAEAAEAEAEAAEAETEAETEAEETGKAAETETGKAAETETGKAAETETGKASGVRITEIHYDNRGRDVNEGFELEVLGRPDAVLGSLTVCLYNGLNGAVYKTIPGSELEVGKRYPEAGRALFFCYTPLQNGGRDGIALVTTREDGAPHTHEFLSWEGVCEATSGPCRGQRSVDIGVREDGTTGPSQSLHRVSHSKWAVGTASMGGL